MSNSVPTGSDWPDSRARKIFESAMLEAHATALSDRYPASIWPSSGSFAGSEREQHGVQAAFVAGIRFACDQLRSIAQDLADEIATLDKEQSP